MIVTTRFNEETWTQNTRFREQNPEFGCIYGPSRRMANSIPLQSIVFVVEMNNTTNRIEGIGLIRNQLFLEKNVRVYHAGNFNRYLYKGTYRLDRNDLDESFVTMWDTLLFRQKTHLKRGLGFTRIPPKLYQHPLCDTLGHTEATIQTHLRVLFKTRFGQTEQIPDTLQEKRI
jgi:hypothetical protein